MLWRVSFRARVVPIRPASVGARDGTTWLAGFSCDFSRILTMANRIQTHRHSAFLAQQGRCYYCGLPTWESDPESFATAHSISAAAAQQFKCTAEHLQARQDGGQDRAQNIVAACLCCNSRRHSGRKQAPSPASYKDLVQKRLRKGRWHCKPILERLST